LFDLVYFVALRFKRAPNIYGLSRLRRNSMKVRIWVTLHLSLHVSLR